MRVAVYTVIIPNGFAQLRPPQIINPEVDHWHISDDQLGLYPWNDLIITRDPKLTSRRDMQAYKMLGHKYLPEYDWLLYHDGNVQLKMDPLDIVKLAQETGKKLFFGRHPWRDCSYEEGAVCAGFKQNNAEIINTQLARYKEEGFPEHFGLVASTFFVRDNKDPKVSEFFDLWHSEVMRGSHRNQVSVGYALWKTGIDYYGSGILWGRNPIWEWGRD
jgi:hypothetical protein